MISEIIAAFAIAGFSIVCMGVASRTFRLQETGRLGDLFLDMLKSLISFATLAAFVYITYWAVAHLS